MTVFMIWLAVYKKSLTSWKFNRTIRCSEKTILYEPFSSIVTNGVSFLQTTQRGWLYKNYSMYF